jgi:hypothetical protein
LGPEGDHSVNEPVNRQEDQDTLISLVKQKNRQRCVKRGR